MRRKSEEMAVTAQAPANEPTKLTAMAGVMAAQGMLTRRLYCQADMVVPQTEALLLVPSSVAGGACGKAANIAGRRISPPPPTIASINPASSEASETKSHSIWGSIVALPRGLSGSSGHKSRAPIKKRRTWPALGKRHLVVCFLYIGLVLWRVVSSAPLRRTEVRLSAWNVLLAPAWCIGGFPKVLADG
ncbi:hypothetical protein D3C71_1623170 [compost metagenome]